MFCSMCGAKLIDGAKFCNMCGSKVELPQTEVPSSEADTTILTSGQPEIPASEADTTILTMEDFNDIQNVSSTQSDHFESIPQPPSVFHPQPEVLAQPDVKPIQASSDNHTNSAYPSVAVTKNNKPGKKMQILIISCASALVLLLSLFIIFKFFIFADRLNYKKMVYSTEINDSGYIYYLSDYEKPKNAIKVNESDKLHFSYDNCFSKDGKYLYLYSFVDDDHECVDLYRVPLKKLKKKKVNDKYLEIIGKDVVSYRVIDDGVIYRDQKGTLYKLKKYDTEILMKNVYSYSFSEDDKTIYYITSKSDDKDYSIGYINISNGEATELAQNIDSRVSVSVDGYFVFSRKENTDENNNLSVYVADKENGAVKVADAVSAVYGIDDNTHKVFYTRNVIKDIPYSDLIEITDEDRLYDSDIDLINNEKMKMSYITLYAAGINEEEQKLADNVTYVEVDEMSGLVTYLRKPENVDILKSGDLDFYDLDKDINSAFESEGRFAYRFGTGEEHELDIRYDYRFILDQNKDKVMVEFVSDSEHPLYLLSPSKEPVRVGSSSDYISGAFINDTFMYIVKNSGGSANLYRYDGKDSELIVENINSGVLVPNKSEFLCKDAGKLNIHKMNGKITESIDVSQLKYYTYIKKNKIIYSEDDGLSGQSINLYKGRSKVKKLVEGAYQYNTYIEQYKLDDESTYISYN
ncbi:MAG: zinc ribbon domain-containing protein [Eubacterium sp.]|nr:zinc ribbon domain-containing protein [Eubacterium sp.]